MMGVSTFSCSICETVNSDILYSDVDILLYSPEEKSLIKKSVNIHHQDEIRMK